MSKFAAFNEQGIYGIGPSAHDALADARFYGADDRTLKVSLISDDLYDLVSREGGNVAFELRNGVLRRAP